MQALVKIGSSQYLVSPGQELLVDQPEISAVLMVVDEGKIEIGKPEVKGVVVDIKVLGPVRGPKIRVAKFKAKSRYRKAIGFRAKYTKVKIESITRESQAVEKPKKAARPVTKKQETKKS